MSDFNDLDLDSLDALLDAAEMDESAMQQGQSSPEESLDDWGAALAEQALAGDAALDNPSSAAEASAETTLDDWGAALAEQAGDAVELDEKAPDTLLPTAAPFVTEAPTPAPTPVPTTEAPAPIPEPSTEAPTLEPTASFAEATVAAESLRNDSFVDDDERISSLRAKRNKNANKEEAWTEEEMDSVKKLVIIFGSIMIVLMLAAIGVSVGGLMSSGKADPQLVETIEAIKSDVSQAYLVTEDGNKQMKKMASQLEEAAAQLAELADQLDSMKSKSVSVASKDSKTMSAAEKKAALRDAAPTEQQAENEAQEGEEQAPVEKVANATQVNALSADIKDVKKRLVETQKLLEDVHKQAEALTQQNQSITETVKSVDQEMKSQAAAKQAAAHAIAVAKAKAKAEEASSGDSMATKPPVKVVKPSDDPAYRAKWSQQMGKSEGFP